MHVDVRPCAEQTQQPRAARSLSRARRGWARLRPAAFAYARSAPVSFGYLLVLVLTTWVLQTSGARVASRLLLERSTNLDHLARDPVRVLVASAFWLSSTWQLSLAAAALVLLVAPLERRIGGRRTIAVLASGHLGATLLVAGGLWIALRADAVGRSVVDARDVGPSYALFAAAACLTYLVERRLRGPFVAALVAYAAATVTMEASFAAVGHLVAIAIGLGCHRVVRNPSPRPGPVGIRGRGSPRGAIGGGGRGPALARLHEPDRPRPDRRTAPPPARWRSPGAAGTLEGMDTNENTQRPVRKDRNARRLGAVLGVLLVGVVGGVVGAAVEGGLGSGPSARAATPPVAGSRVGPTAAARSPIALPRPAGALTPEAIYRQDAPGVVVITDTQTQATPVYPFGPSQSQRVRVLGSGFVLDRTGDVVTNDHVVKGASDVQVGFSNGTTFPGKVVGADPSSDLAVVRANAPASALHPLAFDSSSAVQVGDPAYALGNPFGLDRTLTAGIVSAVGRGIQAPNGLTIPDAIQTDAAINHGDSGGPLLDRFGRVIGINDQIESGGVNGNVGVGFAIGSNTAREVVPQLLSYGKAEHAWLGVEVETIDPAIAGTVAGLPAHGVLVAGVVPGSPAARAGLVAGHRDVTVNGVGAVVGGDAIVSVGGKPVASVGQLADAIALRRPGQTVALGVVQGGRRQMMQVTLGNAPASTTAG
jgi:S1-C subfamily serine protease